jgi:hypothetical protein
MKKQLQFKWSYYAGSITPDDMDYLITDFKKIVKTWFPNSTIIRSIECGDHWESLTLFIPEEDYNDETFNMLEDTILEIFDEFAGSWSFEQIN